MTERPLGHGRLIQERRSRKDSSGGRSYHMVWTARLRMKRGEHASVSFSVRKHGPSARRKAEDWLFRKLVERDRKMRP